MKLTLNLAALRQIFPNALPGVIEAFASADGQGRLATAGITNSPVRLATAFAHCYAETGGFSIHNLTENINYTAERMAAVWPNRFSSAQAVREKYGAAPGWQKKAFDDIYGNRMGNRLGTSDGSSFIGRGGPQVTGRDGYRAVGTLANLPLESQPELACLPEYQPRILAAFWTWKNLGPLADNGNVETTVRPWNGGTNGLAERRAQYARILPIVSGLSNIAAVPVRPPPDIEPTQVPSQPQPASSGLFSILVSVFLAIFKRK